MGAFSLIVVINLLNRTDMFSSIIRQCYNCSRSLTSLTNVVNSWTGFSKTLPITSYVTRFISSDFNKRRRQPYESALDYMSRQPLLPPKYKKHKKFDALKGNPQMKGIIVRLLVKKPKKPNSANRKCAYVRLSDGRHVYAYIPGMGHSLQEHNVVLIEGGGPQDVPYVYCSIIRGKLDCPLPAHKIKKKKSTPSHCKTHLLINLYLMTSEASIKFSVTQK